MTRKEKIDNTLKLWHSTQEELDGMRDFMSMDRINSQFHRRLFIRNIFSVIETQVFVTKEFIKLKVVIDQEQQHELSWAELAVLDEKKAALNLKGNVELKDEFQSFIPTLRFSLNLFSRVFKSLKPDFSNSNFEKLQHLAKRRNDITHPRSLHSLNITDKEIKDSIAMLAWFYSVLGEMHKELLEWLKSIYKDLEP